MKSSPKITITNLPPYVTSRDSSGLTGEYESTYIDYGRFMEDLTARLDQIRFGGQKNRLYKIILKVGMVDEQEELRLVNALSMKSEQDPLRSIMIQTLGTATVAHVEMIL